MNAEETINMIWAMLQTFKMLYYGDAATIVLLHPKLESELMIWSNQHYLQAGNPIDPRKRTIFGLHIVTIMNRPYPFIGIAKAITNEPSTNV